MNNYIFQVEKARKELLKLVNKTDKDLLKVYREAGQMIEARLRRVKKDSATEAYLKELQKTLKIYEEELRIQIKKVIQTSMFDAAYSATIVNIEYFEKLGQDEITKAVKNLYVRLGEEAVRTMISGQYYKDGLTLDNRIWRLTKKNAESIQRLIEVNLLKGANARELAKLVDKYSKNKINKKTLEDGISSKLSYQASRLARTSLTHSFNETIIRNAKANPFVMGIKWNLSPSHFTRQVEKWGEDICDEYANQNLYRLGQGVFPIKETPIAHPNCLCYLTEETVPINEARETLVDWVNGKEVTILDKWDSENNIIKM